MSNFDFINFQPFNVLISNSKKQINTDQNVSHPCEHIKHLHSNQPSQDQAPLSQNNSNLISEVCTIVSNRLRNAMDAFFPLLNLINGGDIQVNELSTIITTVNQNISSNNSSSQQLSPRAREALSRISKAVTTLNNTNTSDSDNQELSQLIQQWRQSGNHQTLIQMAERIRSGQCVSLREPELRRAFIEGLESFAQTLEQAIENEEPDNIQEQIRQGANSLVDGVEVANNANGRELNTRERRRIAQGFEGAMNAAHNISEECGCRNRYHSLSQWSATFIEFITDFIDRVIEESKKEQEESANKEEKELCEERCEQVKRKDDFCIKAKNAKRKEETLSSKIKELKNKLARISIFTNEQSFKNCKNEYHYLEEKLNKNISDTNFYHNMEAQQEITMLPSYVCKEGEGYESETNFIFRVCDC